MKDSRLGLSMAASWSWGASAAVGIGILLTRGQAAFWIWTVANILAVPLFGAVYARWPTLRSLIDLRAVVLPMVAIQVFAYWMNLQAGYEAATGGIDIETVAFAGETVAMVAAILAALGLSAFIYRTGLPGSITTDVGQFGVQVGACVSIVVLGLAFGSPMQEIPTTSAGGLSWAAWAALGLLSGPFLDAQQWQRLEQSESSGRPALWAGAWFGGYMLAVWGAGMILSASAPLLSVLFLVVIVAIASSTIDSAAAALQRLTTRRVALAIGVLAALSWPLVRSAGVVNLWTIYASGRVFVVAALVAYGAAVSKFGVTATPHRDQDIESD